MANGRTVANVFVNVGARTAEFQQGMARASKKLSGFQKAGVAAGIAVAASMAKATAAAVKFERQVAELAKLVGQDAAGPLADSIGELANRLPVARDRLFEVAEAAARLGIRGTENISQFTQVMAEIGVATDVSADRASTAMAKLTKVTGTPIGEVRNLASAINEASNTMAVSFSEVLESAQRAAPGLAQLGASQSEIVALSASMAELSANASRSGTRLNRFASVLQQTDSVQVFASALGVTAERFAEMRDESPGQTVLALAQAMRDGGEAARLMGDELDETSLRVLRTLAQQTDQLEEKLGSLNRAFVEGTSIGDEYQNFAGTAAAKMQTLSNKTTDVAVAIGEHLLPTFKRMLDDMNTFVGTVGPETVAVLEDMEFAAQRLSEVGTGTLGTDFFDQFREAFLQITGLQGAGVLVDALEDLKARLREARLEAEMAGRTFDIFGDNTRRWSNELFFGADAADRAATEVREVGEAAGEAANEAMELSERMEETTRVINQLRLDRATRVMEEYGEAVAGVDEAFTGLVEKTEDFGRVNGEAVTDLNRAVRGAEDATDQTADLARELERAARTGIDFARTLGLIGDSAAATLNSVANLATGIDDLIGAIASGGIGGILSAGASVLGAVGGIVSGLFGGDSEEDKRRQRRAEELRRLNRELDRTVALLRQSGQELANIAAGLIEEGLIDEFKELAKSFSNVHDELTKLEIQTLRDELHRLGLSVTDVQDIARRFGLQIGNLIDILTTGTGDTAKAAAELDALTDIIRSLPDAAEAARRSIDALNERMRDLRNDFERFNIDDPLKKVEKMLEVLRKSAFPGSEGETVTIGGQTFEIGGRTISIPERTITTQEPRDPGPLFDLLQQLGTMNLGLPGQRQTAIGAINDLITSLQAAGQILPDATEDFEEQVEEQLIQLIQFIRDIPELTAEPAPTPSAPTGGTGAGGGRTRPRPRPSPPTVSRPHFLQRAQITEVQANELLAVERSTLVRVEQLVKLARVRNAQLDRMPVGIKRGMDLGLAEDLAREQAAA